MTIKPLPSADLTADQQDMLKAIQRIRAGVVSGQIGGICVFTFDALGDPTEEPEVEGSIRVDTLHYQVSQFAMCLLMADEEED